jgi:hypothetical protein
VLLALIATILSGCSDDDFGEQRDQAMQEARLDPAHCVHGEVEDAERVTFHETLVVIGSLDATLIQCQAHCSLQPSCVGFEITWMIRGQGHEQGDCRGVAIHAYRPLPVENGTNQELRKYCFMPGQQTPPST